MSEAPAIGIDFGTANCIVAVFRNGRVEIMENLSYGDKLTPSFVTILQNNMNLIGQTSKNASAKYPGNTICGVKRLLGRSFDDPIVQESMKHLPYIVLCDGQNNVKLGIVHNDKKITITPVEICTMIFQNIKQTAEAFLGHVCKDAVVTVPSYFSHSQRSATKEAASRAGFNVLNITNEGIAAAMSYEFKEKWSGTKQVVVYDLGSESIDVSVLKLDKGNWKELATACDTSLGGRSFDDRLLEHLASEIQDKHRKDIYSCNQVLAEMRRVCEASKKNLTIYKSATINVELEFPDEVLNFRSTVSRETFDELNVDLFHETLQIIDNALFSAKKDKVLIDKVILVGCSTRIPHIQRLLISYFGIRKICSSICFDETVVIGAAIQASALQKCRNGDRPDVLVTPLSLGIGCGEKSEEMSIMIKRNTVLPTKAEKFFYTRFDFQTSILFQILQGESLRGKKNILLGQLLVTAVPSEMECLQKVLITMNVNKFGILTATAMLDSTGSTSSLVLNIHSKADKTTIDRMLTDTSASNSRRESLLAKSDLKNYCLDCLEIMNDHRNEFLESHRKSILTQISGLMQWMGSEEVFKREEYTMLFENLQKLCNPIFKINDNGEPIFMKD